MIKRDVFVKAATVLKEEIRQQEQLEHYMAEYFDVDCRDLQRKYEDSSQTVLMQLLRDLVGDEDGYLLDWLHDVYEGPDGLFYELMTPCGYSLDMWMKTANDLYDFFHFQKARGKEKCRICSKIHKRHGYICGEEN